MRQRGVLGDLAVAVLASSRAAHAARRWQPAGTAGGSFGEEYFDAAAVDGAAKRQPSTGEQGNAGNSLSFAQHMHERIRLPEVLRDFMLEFVPRYYWIALGRRSGGAAQIGIWEVATSYRGHPSDYVRLVDEFTPCREVPETDRFVLAPPEISFAAFLPGGEDVLVACKDTPQTFFLEVWHVPSGKATHRFEHKFFHHHRYFPYRRLALERLFSYMSEPREWLVAQTLGGVGLWNTTSWDMLWQHRRPGPYATAFSPKGDMFAVAELDWNEPVSFVERVTIFAAPTGRELCGARLPETRLATRRNDRRLGFTGEYLTLCDPHHETSATFRLSFTKQGCELVHTGRDRPCCDATGTGLILYGSSGRMMIGSVFDTTKPLFETTFETPFAWPHPRRACYGRFSPDGGRALFRDGAQWYLWPFASGHPPRPVPAGAQVFSDDGALLVGLGHAGLKLIETRSGAERDVINEPSSVRLAPRDYQELVAVGSAH